jgi:hypothetical protein
MGLSASEVQTKIDNYAAGTSNDLAGISEPTVEKLKGERAQREAMRQVYEAKQAEAAKTREDLLRGRYLSSGGTEDGWRRDKARVLSDDAVNRFQRHSGSLISPAEFLA